MAMSASSFAAPVAQAAPRYVPDLRPSADAAAIKREVRPAAALAVAPVGPPSPTQIAAVSRSMVNATDRTEGVVQNRVEQPHRTLKPFGVVMLPRTEDAERHADRTTANTERAATD